jgi:hypothetical protein
LCEPLAAVLVNCADAGGVASAGQWRKRAPVAAVGLVQVKAPSTLMLARCWRSEQADRQRQAAVGGGYRDHDFGRGGVVAGDADRPVILDADRHEVAHDCRRHAGRLSGRHDAAATAEHEQRPARGGGGEVEIALASIGERDGNRPLFIVQHGLVDGDRRDDRSGD